MSDNIKVVVKVRPLISREIEDKLSYQWRVKNNTLYQLDHNGKEYGPNFTFDKVYDKDTQTTDVYNDIAKPIVQAATAGFNGTIFAYGQTSSGKTYTMTGSETSPGIIPLAVLNLFEIIRNIPDRDFLVRVSYIEIYNETVKDLLTRKDNIRVYETIQGEIKVESTEKVTTSPEEVLEAMKEGEQNRQKGATNMNEQSSRSHTIFQITIESREHVEGEEESGCVNVSQLNLVDLAGSERAGQTGATGIRFKEGTAINKSLSALALVIKQLSEDPNKFANYRDSKLTRILQNSLGGNAKTSIICAVTPAAVEETISTLQFANRAKAIKNKPEVNAVATDATMIQSLTKQMSKLQSKLESKKNIEQDNVNLQKEIAGLRRLIMNGFVQRRSVDAVQGPKRKLQPRRVTIHSTVASVEDEPVLNVPKFCTPSLKYNPMSIPSVSDFVPIQSTNKLASVPEEPLRLITPPPHKTVNFSDEVIELDSDDDSVHGDHETCSPIHKCYGASKTPPCILRNIAKVAERNLKDIVELTEREKIFSPSVVELMEKLEENATTITKLKDDIDVLNRQDKEKDSKIDELQSIIQKNEEEIKVLNSIKTDLQTQCDNFNTKVTDWEVSYETLKNKARLREEELLSLLEETKIKKPQDIGKVLSRTFEKEMHFMDMSKDISLVNSDNENSIVNPDDETENINKILKDTQTQLTLKIQTITELELELFAHKENISSLENLTQELEQTVSTFKEKLSYIEKENTLLKSTMDTLNVTISKQKENLESANNDIESYNRDIQELQIKLTERDSLPNINIDDSDLETVISNEQQFLANNENIVNIIQSFKNALDKRNKQIAELKDAAESNKDLIHNNSDFLVQLETKSELVNNLNFELDKLKKQLNENIAIIAKLGNEKNDLKIIERELACKLAEIEKKNSELENKNIENLLNIQHLNNANNRLTLEIGEKNQEATKQIEELTNKIQHILEIASQKDDLIKSLNEEKMTSDKNILFAKTAVLKLQTILCTLSGDIQEVPEIIDNFVSIFNCLSDGLTSLEVVAANIFTEKGEFNKIKSDLVSQLEELEAKHRSKIETLQQEIDNLRIAEIEHNKENDVLTGTINKLNNDLQELRDELGLQTENQSKVATLKEHIENLSKVETGHILEKETLSETISKLNQEILELRNKLDVTTENYSTIAILQDQVENLSKTETAYLLEKEALTETISKLNQEILELRNKLDVTTENYSTIAILQDQVENLSKTETAYLLEKEALTETISKLNQEILELRNKLDVTTENYSTIAILQDQVENLSKTETAYLPEKEALTETISKLNQEILQLRNELELKTENESVIVTLQDQIENLNKAQIDHKQDKEVLTKKVNTLNQEISELQIELKLKTDKLQEKIEDFSKAAIYHQQEKAALAQTIDKLNHDLQELQNKLDSDTSLESKLNELIELKNLEIADNRRKHSEFEETLLAKDNTISDLSSKLEEVEVILKENIAQKNAFNEQLNHLEKENHKLLTNIFDKITHITNTYNNKNLMGDRSRLYEQIILSLDSIGNHITFINMKNADDDDNGVSEILLEAKKEIKELTQKNLMLLDQLQDIENNHAELMLEIQTHQDDNKSLHNNLTRSEELLKDLHTELNVKSTELSSMEDKVKEWKEQFSNLDVIMKQQMNELKDENENLQSRIQDLESESKLSVAARDHVCDLTTNIDTNSPPSLLTICCNKIVDYMEPRDSDGKSTANSSFDIENQFEVSCYKCDQLFLELEATKEENSKVFELLAQMELMNKELLQEQELVRGELQLLVKPAQELQKKIVNHKTNLSILTATTYAENKSLKSQVKVLQHHHKRFHNVCQRDIPDFKKQLSSLMTLLKGDLSIGDQQNLSFKRYSLPDVLDSSTGLPNFKNESTLDGDLLMLDTNITVTTADNTLTNDQTCLDMTQYYTEASCQTNDFNQINDQNQPQINTVSPNNEDLCEKFYMLNNENAKLRELVEKYSELNKSAIDTQNSHIGNGNHEHEINNEMLKNDEDNAHELLCCKELNTLKGLHEQLNEELESAIEKLNNTKSQNAELEQKYNNLVLETPSTNALVKKLNIFEKEYNSQQQEIIKLKNSLNQNNQEIKRLQEENDSLSTQVMENITEADDLNKNLNSLNEENIQLIAKCKQLEQSTKELVDNAKGGIVCAQCLTKDELIQMLQSKVKNPRAQLNRSLSDSDTSSRYNKICTLQNELHAGKEDCKELTEDVVTIKNHLERSNISMDLDESMEDCNIYAFTKVGSPQANKCKMPDIPEETVLEHIYAMDRLDCFNYCKEKTGAQKDNLNRDMKIIEVMKMLYLHLTTKHGNEVENLTNKLKDFEEAKVLLTKQYFDLEEKHSLAINELEDNNKKCASVANVLFKIKTNINNINEEFITEKDNSKLVNMFMENLSLLDSEFTLGSVKTFESLINKIVHKHQTDLADIIEKYTKLQDHMETLTSELTSVNANLIDMKTQLNARENEYNLLKAQKERVHEITNAVTLDIVKREKELKDTIDKGYQSLIELCIVKPENLDSNLPLNTNINVLFELLVTQSKNSHHVKENEKHVLQDIDTLKSLVEEKQKEIDMLQLRNEKIQDINNCVTIDLVNKENQLQAVNALHEDLNELYNTKVEENNAYIILVDKLTQQVNILNVNVGEKEKTIERLEKELAAQSQQNENDAKVSKLLQTVAALQDEINNLKSLNEAINKEKEDYAEECRKSGETLKNNKTELDKMTSDILVLKESVKESSTVIENLSAEAKSLLEQNMVLKGQLEDKRKESSRLETNIKTHEKTAQIQSKMIMRIEKQKTDVEVQLAATKLQLDELTQKYELLQKVIESSKVELEQLRNSKEELEARILDLEGNLEGYKRRPSIDTMNESSRRRRQSLYDSKHMHSEDRQDFADHNSVEAVFNSRPKPDDLFMDCEDFESSRSTPIRLSKGRDSSSHSKPDQEDEPVSRPSSVLETRRRRQSIHDARRGQLSLTPSPYGGNDSTVSQLRERLATCQQELDDLKEKYRELDEECETCSEYLKERDEQCARLKKEKLSLQSTITDLREKFQSCNPNMSQMNASKPTVAHAAVNTDEDWTNLHSVVVDRMSYDAEVEKNKKLTKTIEELRFKKQDLKNTLAKMQKCLEKNTGSRELEATKQELQACKLELSQLQEKYKELDEECETCAQYLREKEEQCRKLKEAKTALESKLHESQSVESAMPRTARKKRQTLHDQNRPSSAADVTDAATNTEESRNSQVERDSGSRNEKHAQEVKHLKLAVERLMHQKSALEQQLSAMTPSTPAMYVATGSAIVQNQQITDVIKENQKLKKINAKLIHICKKRGKESNRENEDPTNLA